VVLPGIFHPHFTISTRLFLQYLEKQVLENKSFLELGCGTGIISILAAKNGAHVLASDINPLAIENVMQNATHNNVKISTYTSDLFTNIPKQHFNYIVINPPFYPKAPKNINEEAWFCGEGFEYFEKLFSTIGQYFNSQSEVLMILSEDCEINYIEKIALKNQVVFSTVLEKKKWGERNYIFKLKSI
jgi:release factor glutamine methyltransferase